MDDDETIADSGDTTDSAAFAAAPEVEHNVLRRLSFVSVDGDHDDDEDLEDL